MASLRLVLTQTGRKYLNITINQQNRFHLNFVTPKRCYSIQGCPTDDGACDVSIFRAVVEIFGCLMHITNLYRKAWFSVYIRAIQNAQASPVSPRMASNTTASWKEN